MSTSAPEVTPDVEKPSVSLLIPGIVIAIADALALGLSIWQGHVWFGIFFVIGTLMIIANTRFAVKAVTEIAALDNPPKAALAFNSLLRLAIITVVALVLAFLVRPDGLGLLFGLAVGQLLLMASTVGSVLKGLR